MNNCKGECGEDVCVTPGCGDDKCSDCHRYLWDCTCTDGADDEC